MSRTFHNITSVFWPIAQAIIALDYDVLQNTKLFHTLQQLVHMEHGFILDMDTNGATLTHNDVNELFYNTLSYCRRYEPHSARTNLLERAIAKIEAILTDIQMHNDAATTGNASDIAHLDSLLSKLTL